MIQVIPWSKSLHPLRVLRLLTDRKRTNHRPHVRLSAHFLLPKPGALDRPVGLGSVFSARKWLRQSRDTNSFLGTLVQHTQYILVPLMKLLLDPAYSFSGVYSLRFSSGVRPEGLTQPGLHAAAPNLIAGVDTPAISCYLSTISCKPVKIGYLNSWVIVRFVPKPYGVLRVQSLPPT